MSRIPVHALPLVACWLLLLAAGPIDASAQTNITIRGPLVAMLEPDRDRIYAGEVFTLYFSVFSDGPDLSNEMQLNRLPDDTVLRLEKFSAPLTVEQRQLGERRQIRRYRVKAVAMKPGRIRIAPELTATVVRRTKGVFSTLRFRSVQIPVVPIELPVEAIPEAGRPTDYSGVIGRASFDVEVDSVSPALGDLVTITMRVSSPEKLPDIDPPQLSLSRHFRSYPTRTLPVDAPNERIFEKTVIPLSTNAHTIPPVRFTYFDTATHNYASVERGPFQLTFTERAQDNPKRPVVITEPSVPAEIVTVDTTPIPPADWTSPPTPWLHRKAYWSIQAIPIAIYLGLPLIRRRPRTVAANRTLLLPLICLLGASLAWALDRTPSAQEQAYDAHQSGKHREASALYEEIATAGTRSAELFYNLGSTHYLGGRLGHAVLNYARAHRLDPRNPTFETNLARSADVAGVPNPLVFRLTRWHRLTLYQWTAIATAAYWLLIICAGIRRLSSKPSPALAWVCLLLLAAGGYAAHGAWHWERPEHTSRGIVVREAKARFGPMRNARVQFPLREGSSIQILEAHGEWRKIDANGSRGWIERDAVEPLLL